jgi:hypothetical protein
LYYGVHVSTNDDGDDDDDEADSGASLKMAVTAAKEQHAVLN